MGSYKDFLASQEAFDDDIQTNDEFDDDFDSAPAPRRRSDEYRHRDSREEYIDDDSRAARPEKHRKKSNLIPVLAVLLIICNLLFFAWLYFNLNYAIIGSFPLGMKICRLDTVSLSLTDGKVSSYKGLDKLRDLRYLDLRGVGVSADDYLDIRESTPDGCEILWDIHIGSLVFDSGCDTVSFSDAADDELQLLRYMDSLQSVNATGCTNYELLRELCLEMPQCSYKWEIPFNGAVYPSDTTELTVQAPIEADELEKIKLFPFLKSVDASAYNDTAQLIRLSDELPACDILWRVDLAGTQVSSTARSVDISGTHIWDINAFAEQLTMLPRLTYVDMCDCGLSNEQMADLCSRFPDKKLVWKISFGDPDIKSWELRTDATVFSTLNPAGGTPYDQNTFAPLFLYCTDLVALDLGHNRITDCSLIANLKHLKFLILGDNRITDISPLSALTELECLEIWYNNFTDISPICKLPNLVDIDFSNNKIRDLTPIYRMKNLQTLRIMVSDELSDPEDPRNPLTTAQINEVKAALPNCYIELYDPEAFFQFRHNDKYLAMKVVFSNYDKVVYFNDWDDLKMAASYY